MAEAPVKYRDKKTGEYYIKWIDSAGQTIRQHEPKPSSPSQSSKSHSKITRTGHSSNIQHRPRKDKSIVKDSGVGGFTDPQYTHERPPLKDGTVETHGTSHTTRYNETGGYDPPQSLEDPDGEHIITSTIPEIETVMRDMGLEDQYYTTTAKTPNSSEDPPLRQDTVHPSRVIKGSKGNTERLDNSYRVRNTDFKKFFRVGRVFSTLWTEGVGWNSKRVDQTFISEVIYQEKVHSKVRRFVVVKYKEGDTSCWCLPVTSYDGLGPKKKGITLGDHGFIYSNRLPERVAGMLPQPLKVHLSKGNTQLTEPSLVNYGKVYTVETNVKVKDVGDLDSSSRSILRDYFQQILRGVGDETGEMSSPPTASVLAHVGAGLESTDSRGYNESLYAPRTYSYSVPYSGGSNSLAPSYGTGGTYKYAGPVSYSTNQPGYTQQLQQPYYQNNVPTATYYQDPTQYAPDAPPVFAEEDTTYVNQNDYQPEDSSGNRQYEQTWQSGDQQYSNYGRQATASDESEIVLPLDAEYVAAHDPHAKTWRENKGKERLRSHRSGQNRH